MPVSTYEDLNKLQILYYHKNIEMIYKCTLVPLFIISVYFKRAVPLNASEQFYGILLRNSVDREINIEILRSDLLC